MKAYISRIADQQIKQKLAIMGAVLIEGPKWCGKTTTAEQFTKSQLYLADPDKKKDYQIIGNADPKSLLDGEKPRLIDEWQVAPKLWDAICFDVDHSQSLGRYILTGSSTPQNKKDIFHSGTGRFAWVKMRPLSLYESGDSNGTVSLETLFDGPEGLSAKANEITLKQLAFLSCRGGWPHCQKIPSKSASLQVAFEYINGLVRGDFSPSETFDERKTNRLRKLLRSLARNQGTQATLETIKNDMGKNTTSPNTLKADLNELRRLFVIEDALAWNPNLRSQTAIRTSDTRFFVDPSIATAALGLGPQDLIEDMNTFGLVFETLCFRDLRIYAELLNGDLYHYRDRNGLECDAVLHLRNGKYGLIEIKIGGDDLIEEGAASLLDLASKIDTDKMPAPSFKMVLTGVGSYAYQREDGVYVVPIGCLKP